MDVRERMGNKKKFEEIMGAKFLKLMTLNHRSKKLRECQTG